MRFSPLNNVREEAVCRYAFFSSLHSYGGGAPTLLLLTYTAVEHHLIKLPFYRGGECSPRRVPHYIVGAGTHTSNAASVAAPRQSIFHITLNLRNSSIHHSRELRKGFIVDGAALYSNQRGVIIYCRTVGI